jgi:5-formyltetrahydrofolate cyclo-ligase
MITHADTIRRHKATLRRQIRTELGRLVAAHRASAAAKAIGRLLQQPAWLNAQSVLSFAPLPDEMDISPLLSLALTAGKQIALPRYVPEGGGYVACRVQDPETDLVLGRFGVLEPGERCVIVPFLRFDLVLVPGVAFDLQGRRLGRGKGFYDQILAAVHGRTCGIAFDEQIVREVPVEPHDIPVHCILTPTRWVEM